MSVFIKVGFSLPYVLTKHSIGRVACIIFFFSFWRGWGEREGEARDCETVWVCASADAGEGEG